MKENDVVDKIANGGFHGLAACPECVSDWYWKTISGKKILTMTFSFEKDNISEDD